MDTPILYSISGIIVLFIVIIITFQSSKKSKKSIKTKSQKRAEILDAYRSELKDALSESKEENRVAVKTALLKKFNQELSMNIFFDKDEIKEIIYELNK